jgi:NFU1 iron-sulfur cluster scaffold homolog, mitochondrial
MALFQTFLKAIGLARPLYAKPLQPLRFGEAALSHLSRMAPEWALHVETHPTELGRVLVAREGPAEGPPPPDFDQPIVISDSDLNWLEGLILDKDEQGWHLRIQLKMATRETPNPNGRMYLYDRTLAHGSQLYFTQPEKAPPLARQLLALPGVVAVFFRENTVTVEREPNLPWSTLDPQMEVALKSHFLACGKALTNADVENFRTPLENEIMAVLRETILPNIHQDGGDLNLLGVTDGVVKVSLVGACRSCPASALTLKAGIEKTLKTHFPHTIHSVEAVDPETSSTGSHEGS